MTKTKRITTALKGLLILLFAAILILAPEEGPGEVTVIVGLGLALKGFGEIVYYFHMARFMVGGKYVLYRGIIILDVGLIATSMAAEKGVLIILCVAIINAATGIIAILRARETRGAGSPKWKYYVSYGVVSIILVVLVILSMIFQSKPIIAVYVYAFHLAHVGFQKFSSALKKTAIVYIP